MWQQGCLLLQTGKQMFLAWPLGSDLLTIRQIPWGWESQQPKRDRAKNMAQHQRWHPTQVEPKVISLWTRSSGIARSPFYLALNNVCPGHVRLQKQESLLNHNNLRITETSESPPAASFKAVVPVLRLHQSSTLNPSLRLPQFHFKHGETQKVKQVL